jgi:hypothetical protein
VLPDGTSVSKDSNRFRKPFYCRRVFQKPEIFNVFIYFVPRPEMAHSGHFAIPDQLVERSQLFPAPALWVNVAFAIAFQ